MEGDRKFRVSQIAKVLKFSPDTLSRWAKRMGVAEHDGKNGRPVKVDEEGVLILSLLGACRESGIGLGRTQQIAEKFRKNIRVLSHLDRTNRGR
jgi:Fe-S cluster biogenesis protein NfuA